MGKVWISVCVDTVFSNLVQGPWVSQKALLNVLLLLLMWKLGVSMYEGMYEFRQEK